jgi:hypothetical protein
MVAEARRRRMQFGVEIDITQSSWQDLPQRVPGAFELVLCLGNSIVHTATKSNMISSLEGLKQVLSPDGVLVVDSRNWEQLSESRPRIITNRRAIERRGVRPSLFYVWTIPDDFNAPCRAEIVLLFEGPGLGHNPSAVRDRFHAIHAGGSHRRHSRCRTYRNWRLLSTG